MLVSWGTIDVHWGLYMCCHVVISTTYQNGWNKGVVVGFNQSMDTTVWAEVRCRALGLRVLVGLPLAARALMVGSEHVSTST